MDEAILEKLEIALQEESQFWFEVPQDDLEKETRESSERFSKYLARIGRA